MSNEPKDKKAMENLGASSSLQQKDRAPAPAWTPGPWGIDPMGRPDHKYTWVFGADGTPIAGTSGRILIPNARLIAAAPELYEALEQAAIRIHEAHREMERFVDGFTAQPVGDFMECDAPPCAQLAATLAKARGEV